jgi:hypothetical protein
MTSPTYQVWIGEYWMFEQIVENLGKLVRSIVARTTPEEEIDDCMQDAWLRLYERLENDPQVLGPNPRSKSLLAATVSLSHQFRFEKWRGWKASPLRFWIVVAEQVASDENAAHDTSCY